MPDPIKTYHKNGNIYYEQWLENSKFHRINDPAFQEWDIDGNLIYEIWFENNLLHRINGPASIWYDKDGSIIKEEWFVNDIKLTDKEITVLKRKLKLCQIQQ